MDNFDIPFVDKNSERKMLIQRVGRITEHLRKRMYSDTEKVGGFLFRDGQYRISELNDGEWRPFGENEYWGYPEEYCWFKHTVTVPERFKGKKVFYEINVHLNKAWQNESTQQFIAFVNGKMTQGIDSNHKAFILTNCAEGGETFEIALNAYCDMWTFRGQSQLTASLCVLDEDVKNLIFDLSTPYDVAHMYSYDDMPRIDIVKALNEAVNLLDMHTDDYEAFNASVKAASKYIDEHIYGADSFALASAIGHTHIDTAWLWRLRQTREKAGRTFSTVVNFMREYPDFKFMSSQAQLYDFVKQDYPELFEEIKEMVKQRRWEPEGGMWVESDTNVISGESLVRQFLVGKRFFKDEFGVENEIMWLPDVFGYSAALPQIMKLAKIKYFMTTKISWSEYNRFPYDTFMWKGIDGTEILSHFICTSRDDDRITWETRYNGDLCPRDVIGGWKRFSQKDISDNILFSFGYGDGGGGPTRTMIEKGIRMNKGIEGCPKVDFEFTHDYFERLEKTVKGNKRLPKWSGELYLELHRGTLTSQARNKRYNRKNEILYHDVETLCETAHILKGDAYPADKILDSWKIILLNQFHDIIPGSSIEDVYKDSKVQYEEILGVGKKLADGAISSIVSSLKLKNNSLVVFNTLGFERDDVVITDMPDCGSFIITDENGVEMPSQKSYDGKLVFLAKGVPAKGFKAFNIVPSDKKADCTAIADTKGAENKYYVLKFDENMNISSLIHKATGRAVAPEGEVINRLVAYEDKPQNYDAWDIKCFFSEKYWYIDDVTSCETVECGSVRTVVKVVRKFNKSLIEQYFIFYNEKERIDISYVLDWKESDIALKTDNPVDVNAVNATYDIQFGNIERTAHNNTTWDFAKFETCGHKWADLSDNSFGLSILNDCKYGWTIKEGNIRPTLLRCATDPNHNQDREMHWFTYSLYPHSGAVCTSDVVYEGYSLNVPLYCALAPASDGDLAPEYSLINVDKSNVIIETVKKAEDGNEMIVRMYETWNKQTDCAVSLGVDVKNASICDLMEDDIENVDFDNNSIKLTFKPFEIKTLKITM
ncbi:MAG: alpha-mannosidase [Clostridiales bacterium]|nr:alpha-mannosidase [Clostridiales bacterium]